MELQRIRSYCFEVLGSLGLMEWHAQVLNVNSAETGQDPLTSEEQLAIAAPGVRLAYSIIPKG